MNLFYGDALENEGDQNEEDVEDFLALLVEEPVVKVYDHWQEDWKLHVDGIEPGPRQALASVLGHELVSIRIFHRFLRGAIFIYHAFDVFLEAWIESEIIDEEQIFQPCADP